MPENKSQLDAQYATPDPWGYQLNPQDILRRSLITRIANAWGPYFRSLDIGAGEGWVTQEYNSLKRYGFELSDLAASRFPAGVERVENPHGKYDLVTATGVFYRHYDWQRFYDMIMTHADGIVVVSSIKDWEVNEVSQIGKIIFMAEFPYREYTQRLRVFDRRA